MYRIGQVVEGIITAVKPYGAFVKVGEDDKGLIHISEIGDYFINKVSTFFKVGERVVVKIIDIDEFGQLRLSLKAIQSNRKVALPSRKDIVKINKIGFESLRQQLPKWIEENKEKV